MSTQRTHHPKKRPNLPRASEEMKRASTLLGEELLRWPGVSSRPMFGLRAYYRKAFIFAMLPDKRTFESPQGIAYKEEAKWEVFEIKDSQEIGAALAILRTAYDDATGRRSSDNRE